MSILNQIEKQIHKIWLFSTNTQKKGKRLQNRSLRLEALEARQLLAVDLASSGIAAAEALESPASDADIAVPLTETAAENAEPLKITLSTESPSIGTVITTETPYSAREVKYQWFRVASDGTETAVENKESYRYKVTASDVGYSLKVVLIGRGKLEGRTGTAATETSVSLATPELLLLKVRYGEITAVWHTVQAADRYSITYSADPDFSASETVQTDVNRLTVAASTLGATYYFRLQALDSTGKALDSAISETVSAVQNCLETPKLTSIKANGRAISLAWNAVVDTEFYEVNYSTDGFETFETKIFDSETTSGIISGLTMGEKYSVRLRARNTLGQNDFSSLWTKRSVTVNRLATPMIQSLLRDDFDISVSWEESLYADRFIIYYADNADFIGRKTIVMNQLSSISIDGLKDGVTYYFTVQARDTSGHYKNSAFAGVCSFAYENRSINEMSYNDSAFDGDNDLDVWEDSLLDEISSNNF